MHAGCANKHQLNLKDQELCCFLCHHRKEKKNGNVPSGYMFCIINYWLVVSTQLPQTNGGGNEKNKKK